MGDAGRPADDGEIEAMQAQIGLAARQGVHGFSTGLIYAPARYAERAELAALVAVAARHGLLFSIHVRDEASRGLEAGSPDILCTACSSESRPRSRT